MAEKVVQARTAEKQRATGRGWSKIHASIDILSPLIYLAPLPMTSQSYHEIMSPSRVNLLMKS